MAGPYSTAVWTNYNDLKNSIHETTEYLEIFLRNLLLNENHPLHNQTLHISGAFREPGKVNIEEEKTNIGEEKVNIEEAFTAKTAAHVRALREALDSQPAFGRSDVQKILRLKPTRSSALLREMAEHRIIEPVSDTGKESTGFDSRSGETISPSVFLYSKTHFHVFGRKSAKKRLISRVQPLDQPILSSMISCLLVWTAK